VSCLLAYLISRRLMAERLARLAGALCVVFLPHAYFAVMFWSENLFVPLFAAAVLLLLVVVEPLPWPVGADDAAVAERRRVFGDLSPVECLLFSGAAGLLLGATVLTRPFALLAGPLFALVLVAHLRWRGFLVACILGLTTILAVAPWTYRNHLVHRRFVPVATNGGSTFYGGNNYRVIGKQWRLLGSWVSTVELPGRDEIEAAPDEVSHDAVEWRLGREWVKENPDRAALLIPLKVARLIAWLPDFDGGRRYYYIIRAAIYLPFLPLILVGVWRASGEMRSPGWWVMHSAVFATVLTAMIFWGSPRFRDANAPLLMVYAALAFARREENPR
jgi:hypothetical protein